jgi:predicted CXXCH cytochrome family protein
MTITGGIPSSSPSYFGTSLANHHPISFSYSTSLANPEISPVPPANLLLYGNDVIQCTTCHDPHDNTNKKFLAVSNENSGLCVLCHTMYGWSGSSHATSLNTWNLVSPNPWPRTWSSGFWDFGWTTVKQNGCENCHAPHAAGSTSRLLNEEAEEQNCYPCHNGHVASKNIQDQFIKASRHRVDAYMGTHDPKESLPILTAHVECVDCHNPHASNSATTAPPFVSGKLQKVSGIDRNGVRILPPDFAQYEYEICFKCHGDSSSLFPFIERYINTSNTRVEFNPNNASYHPVIDMGKASISGVPSLNPASTDPEAPQGLNASSFIACTDCHSDEVVNNNVLMSRGPHGSPYAPILRRQYLTTVGIPEGLQSYGLCYRCHNRTSILSDVSFGKNSVGKGGHSGHLNTIGSTQVDASCSVCHDPHGVPDTGAGSHTHLINFDKRYVNDTPAPVYTDLGSHSGSCTLVCHDAAGNAVIHNGSSTFSYGGGGAIQIQF